MTARDSFVLRICTDPADDLPRLVLADWLDENGEPERAEFIRVQVELARHPDAQRGRERELWARLVSGFAVALPGYFVDLAGDEVDVDATTGRGAIVRRGFVDEIRCPLDAFLEHAESLFRNHPITRVVLTDVQPAPVLPEMGWGFERLAGRRGWQDHELPDEIWSQLPLGDFANPRRRWYRTRERADGCLSDACVYYGREQAGLPELEVVRV